MWRDASPRKVVMREGGRGGGETVQTGQHRQGGQGDAEYFERSDDLVRHQAFSRAFIS